ncbi:MAG: ABC transporter permease, partial [Candidatus Zixiibacteriota bacterium]
MSKMWVIIKREYGEVVKKKSFLIGVILTPLFMTAVMILPALLADRKPSATERIAIIDLDGRGVGGRFKEAISKYKVGD